MGRCCPGRDDPEGFQRKLGLMAVAGIVLVTALIAMTWCSAHPELFRRHLDFSLPVDHESQPMPRMALDRG